jgi:hypothetical protein
MFAELSLALQALRVLRAALLERVADPDARALVSRSLDAAVEHVRAAALAAGVRP